jgi:hypothetical protein
MKKNSILTSLTATARKEAKEIGRVLSDAVCEGAQKALEQASEALKKKLEQFKSNTKDDEK